MLKTVFDAEDAALVEMARKAIDAGDFVRHTIVALDAWVETSSAWLHPSDVEWARFSRI